MNALEIHGLGKAFRHYGSEWRRVLSWFGLPFSPVAEHWVLRDISFSAAPGEALGIVGQNGAGKSTLLKLICGTLRPSEGHFRVNGRIAALLELGLGFNLEFSGRQNAYHAAGLMGFSHGEIMRVMPWIQEFAEVGDYFDQPLRTYSSGMHVRVAFAVATAFRPDVLIVDEALSVGDAYFQHKSFNQIREFQRQGTTLLIVSHDRSAVQSLCGRALLLEAGVLRKDGPPEEVMNEYNALIARKGSTSIEQIRLPDGRVRTTSGTGEARIEAVRLVSREGQEIEFVEIGEPVTLEISAAILRPIPELVIGYSIRNRVGVCVFGTNTFHLGEKIGPLEAGGRLKYGFTFPADFGPGSYSISVALHAGDTHLGGNYAWRDLAAVFHVANHGRPVFEGISWIPTKIERSP